jgi:NAD(P) transhydrogenase subunit beta
VNQQWTDLAYLLASVLFIFGIKGMTHPRTAVRGNGMSAVAMLIAVIVTVTQPGFGGIGWIWVIAGLAIGGVIGLVMAVRIQMTQMPQLVALFNGFGGGASIFVAWAETMNFNTDTPLQTTVAAAAAGLIGTVTLTGSLVAFAKLEEIKQFKKPHVLPAHQLINGGLFLGALVFAILLATTPSGYMSPLLFLLLVGLALVLGYTLVAPIGGADMPVVIALLNSYSGLAAAATGFVIAASQPASGNMLIIAGSLVGASGLILTSIMCKAMNRSLTNVLFGKIDASAAGSTADEVYEGKIKATSADEIAMMLDGAQRVVVVPGYGMAVAQAQHAVRDLFNLLESRGVNVEFAIHPVAGRMPGHMNVLLAEVDVPYDKLVEADNINPTMETVDLAIVLGANDVVNPDARKSDSPIAGMPIVDVDKARTVIVIKRSLSPGFAGIPNPLFANENTLMYFGDGKKTVTDLIGALKDV